MGVLEAMVEPDVDRLRSALVSGPRQEAVIDLRLPCGGNVDVDFAFAVRGPSDTERLRFDRLTIDDLADGRSPFDSQVGASATRAPAPRRMVGLDELALATFAGLLGVLILNVFDVITTRWALSIAHSRGLHAVEANPLARLLLANWWVEVVKIAALVGLAYRAVTRPARLQVVCVLWAVVGFYAMVVISNAMSLWALR